MKVQQDVEQRCWNSGHVRTCDVTESFVGRRFKRKLSPVCKKNKIILSHSLVAYFFLALATTPESDDVRLSQCFHPGATLGLWSQRSRCCVFRLLCFLPVPVLSFLCCVAGCGSIRLLKLTRLHPAEIVLCF